MEGQRGDVEPDAQSSIVERTVGPADKGVLAVRGFRQALDRDMGEASRQGGRGPAHDLTLEARPWGVPFEGIRVPIEIWHGEDDRVVSPEQSRILARTLPLVTEHLVPGDSHVSLFDRHADETLQSLLSGHPWRAVSWRDLRRERPARLVSQPARTSKGSSTRMPS